MDIKLLVGNNIKYYRKKQGLSQVDLAHLSDLHRTYISDVERGKINISVENMLRISNALNIHITYLLTEKENNKH